MFNEKIIKKAAADLETTDANHIVKVASILGSLRAWYNNLLDPQYKEKVRQLKDHSSKFKQDMIELNRYMNEVDDSIKSGDLIRYDIALDELKRATISMSENLKTLNDSANEAGPPIEPKNMSKNKPRVLLRQNTLNTPNVKNYLETSLKSSGFSDEEIKEIISDNQFKLDIEKALQNGEMIGSAVQVTGGKNDKRIGEMWVTYQTPVFNLTNYPVSMSIKAVLTDLTQRVNSPQDIMSVTRFQEVQTNKTTTSNKIFNFIKEAKDFSRFKGTDWEWAFNKVSIEKKINQYNKANHVPAKKTPISKEDFKSSLINIWDDVFPDIPITNEAIGILWAQTSLETGNFKHMYNYNLGNVKATPSWSQSNLWTNFSTSEVINGEEIKFSKYHPVSFWRAFETLEEGMKQYLSVLAKGYRSAVIAASKGDTEKFVRELKKNRYFTASESKYNTAVSRIYEQYKEKEENSSFNQMADIDIPENTPTEMKNIIYDLANYFKTANPLSNIVKQSIANNLLPRSDFTIQIKAINEDYFTKVTYASILSDALEDSIGAETDILSNGKEVDIHCSIAGCMNSTTKAAEAINMIASKSFAKKHKKMAYGSIKPNTISKLSKMDALKIDRNKIKFYLKGKTND